MKNADQPAMPGHEYGADGNLAKGLSKREHFAALAMQGFLANSWQAKDLDSSGVTSSEQMATVAEISCFMADALLAELERTS